MGRRRGTRLSASRSRDFAQGTTLKFRMVVAADVGLGTHPLDHVRVVQLERRAPERIRGSSVKLCRGGGHEAAHSSEFPWPHGSSTVTGSP